MDKKIDYDTWQRKELFEFFTKAADPTYSVTFRLDVTKLYNYVKSNNLSFYFSLIYLCAKAINQVEQFRYTIRKDGIYLLQERIPSFTDLNKDDEQFHIVTMKCNGDLKSFSENARQKSSNQNSFIDYSLEGDNLIYISCLPWFDLTGKTTEKYSEGQQLKDSFIPNICWGKYIDKDGKKELGMCIEVNHRLIDGVHIGKFVQILEESINNL